MTVADLAHTDRPRTEAADGELELSIVLPCLNEVLTVGTCVKKAVRYLERAGVRGEVIVADNGSTDGSQALARRLGARVVDVPARGYGAALRAGIRAARGRYVVMGDSDDSYDFTDLDPFLHKLREGYDLVNGNRFRGGILPGAMPLSHRYLGNPALTFIGRTLFKAPCGDFYCGQRGFRRDKVQDLDLQSSGMEFALEMLVKGTMHGLRVTEVPIKLHKDGRDRAPHLRTWRDGWRSLRFFLHYSPRWLFLYPGLLLVAIGLIAGAWLMGGARTVAGVSFDVHTLLYCAAAITVGVQLVLFSLFGKLLAIGAGLHPPSPRLERLLGKTPLEVGLGVGAALVLAGLGGSGYAASWWAGTSFGALDPFAVMRVAIPAVLALTVGCQVIFSSFYLYMLSLQYRRLPRQRAS